MLSGDNVRSIPKCFMINGVFKKITLFSCTAGTDRLEQIVWESKKISHNIDYTYSTFFMEKYGASSLQPVGTKY